MAAGNTQQQTAACFAMSFSSPGCPDSFAEGGTADRGHEVRLASRGVLRPSVDPSVCFRGARASNASPAMPTPPGINAMQAGLPRTYDTVCAARWTRVAAML